MSWRDARSGVAHANLPRGSRTGIAAVRPDRRPAGSPSGPVSAQRTSGYYYADYLVQAVQNGQVSETTLDTMVSRLLTQMFRFGMFDKAPTGSDHHHRHHPAHAQVALQGDEEGTVLLKNNGILPLSASSRGSVAMIGVDGSSGAQTIGGGSGRIPK